MPSHVGKHKMITRKRIPGCLRCQERHVKCDRGKPTCNSCRSLKYPAVCEYASKRLRFRQSRYTASTDIPGQEAASVRTPSTNGDDLRATPGPSDTTHAAPSTLPNFGSHHPSSINDINSARTLSSGHSPVTSPVPTAEDTGQFSSSPLAIARIPLMPEINGSSAPSNLSHYRASVDNEHASPNATAFQIDPPPSLTLTEEIDCKVFAFYVERAGHWIGIGSPEGYFHSYVPQLALREPLLLAACLSCASHLMYLLGMVEKEVEQYYSDRVVSLMILSLSSDQANSSNEALLATVVILRMSEQFLELNSDTQRHLQGAASLFLDGTDWSPVESNLAISCFWTYLRESIRILFLREKPCPFELGHLSLRDDGMTAPAETEGVWTNRMTYLIIRVCSLCWGPPQQHPTAASSNLKCLLEKWRAHLPPSFRPWCIYENDNEPFPNIRYFAPWHVVAWQFYYAAKVMLAVYYPDDWANKNLHEMHRYIETAILVPTRLLCGLCMSNTTNVGTNLNGSHLMAWCGQFLSGRAEQQHLLGFLAEFSHNTKWPSRVDCTRLEETWAKSKQPWLACLGASSGL